MQADVEIIKAEERIRPGNSEVQRLCGDNSRLLQFTSWSPRYSLEDGLKETIDWFTQPGVLSGYKTDIYNV